MEAEYCWICIGSYMIRISCTSNSRIIKCVTLWTSSKVLIQCRICFFDLNKRFSDPHLNFDLNINRPFSS